MIGAVNVLQATTIEGAITLLVFVAGGLGAYHQLKKQLINTLNAQIAKVVQEGLEKALKPIVDKLNNTMEGNDALLAFRLERECDRATRRGYISQSGREAIIKMQKPYLDSGHNGAIKDKCERALRLPTVSDEEFNRRLENDCYYLDAISREEREE